MGSLCKGIRCFLKLHSGSHPFVPYINDLPDDAVLVLMSILIDTTVYCKYHGVSLLWQRPVLASELESDLEWGRKWLVNFSVGKIIAIITIL